MYFKSFLVTSVLLIVIFVGCSNPGLSSVSQLTDSSQAILINGTNLKKIRLWSGPIQSLLLSAADVKSYYGNVNFITSVPGLDHPLWNLAFWEIEHKINVLGYADGPTVDHTGNSNEYLLASDPNTTDGVLCGHIFDEWNNPSDGTAMEAILGFSNAKKRWPNIFNFTYVVDPLVPNNRFKDGVVNGCIDIAVIEAYVSSEDIFKNPINYPLSWLTIQGRVKELALANVLNKTIIMLGPVVPWTDGTRNDDHMTRYNILYKLISKIHDNYPEMPGMGFYGVPAVPISDINTIRLSWSLNSVLGQYYGDDVIFLDGFESTNFSSGKWVPWGTMSTNFWVQGSDAEYVAHFLNGVGISRSISTVGYNNIVVHYMRQTNNFGYKSVDHFYAVWSGDGGITWNTIEDVDYIQGWKQVDISLPAGASNNPNFKLKFYSMGYNGSNSNLDLVRVTGDPN